jgi:hypothetical protein
LLLLVVVLADLITAAVVELVVLELEPRSLWLVGSLMQLLLALAGL